MRILFTIFIVALGLSTVFAQEDEGFVLVKKGDNIFIYERWITFPKSDPPVTAREVKGEFFYRNSVSEGVRLLQDEKLIFKWQDHVSEFKVYKQRDSTTWTEYSYHDIPWPVSDQDHLLRYDVMKNTPTEVFIVFESISDEELAPLRKGVTRMQLSGSWTFKRYDAQRVKATYRILSMPMNIPKFLTDPIIRNNMMTTIEEYIALMERNKK